MSDAGDLLELVPAHWRENLQRILAASDFVAAQLKREPEFFRAAFAEGEIDHSFGAGELAVKVHAHCEPASSEADFMARLRQARNRALVRIVLRDLAGKAELDEILLALSELADAACTATLSWCQQQLDAAHGRPRTAQGVEIRPVIIGMGKLGGHELNFSSDIDLIFCFPEHGETDGSRPLHTDRYFARLVADFTRLLTTLTPEGFVYRVDWRLRPFGEAGPPAVSFDAMEQYYLVHGREWERYALIKARPVAGDLAAGQQLLKNLQPFVYRRYLDFSAIDSLRDLKRKIAAEVRRKDLKQHIKLGPGGIRECEFIVQAFQLIRGGQERSLRDNRLRPVLAHLAEAEHLQAEAAQQLDQAYVLLRRIENALQMRRDEQQHELPEDETGRAALCAALQVENWAALMAQLDAARAVVSEQFGLLFQSPEEDADDETLETALNHWWEQRDDSLPVALRSAGFDEPEPVVAALVHLREARGTRVLSADAARRLRRMLPLLLADAGDSDKPTLAAERALRVIENISGRTTYLSLLWESAVARAQLVKLCASSPWITDLIGQTPALLDALLDARSLYRPPEQQDMCEALDEICAEILPDDTEALMDALRRYRQEVTLRIAAAEVVEALPLVKVSDRLTWLAEVIVAKALELAWADMRQTYGTPMRKDGTEAGFSVIGYGKCGGIEMGYGSDLDLVFLHDCDQPDAETVAGERPIAGGVFYARLAQRIVHWLSTQTGAGRAYEVDLRLRPSGASGLLVTSLGGFAEYQEKNAWTWEHQALVRARPVAGDAMLGEAFKLIRRQTLARSRDTEQLRTDVLEMRAKMRKELLKKEAGRVDLKQAEGGLTDIEFLTQYLVLRHCAAHPALIEFSDNWRQTDALVEAGVLQAEDAEVLIDAYRSYRTWMHARNLQKQDALCDEGQFVEERAAVQRLWASKLQDTI